MLRASFNVQSVHFSMTIQDAYSDWAATYDLDRNLTRDLDQFVAENSLAKLRCRSVLEIGSGTGKNTTLLSRIGKHVLALDFSEAMVEKAKRKVQASHVSFIVGDITVSWPMKSQSFDLVAGNLVLEHVRDLSFVFSEASRVLVLGGRFFVCELHPFRQYGGTQASFQRNNSTTAIPAYVHHVSDFISSGRRNHFSVASINEWWHQEDQGKPPRLISFVFEKRASDEDGH